MFSGLQVVTPGSFVARLSIELVRVAADRRAGIRRGVGDRPAPSLAAVAITLADLAGEGASRAERRVPPALACYPREDGRRLVALAYVGALERLGAARGSDMSGDRAGASGGVSDGGAAVRVDEAAFLRLVRAFLQARGVVLAVRRAGHRRSIQAIDLFEGVVCDGLSFSAILRAHGWAPKAQALKILGDEFAEILHAAADRFGYRARLPRA